MAIKLNERELDFLVTGCYKSCGIFHKEYALDQVTVTLHYLEKTVTSRRLVIGNSGFDEVSCAVKLVAIAVRKYQVRINLLMLGIEISVIALCAPHTFDEFFAKRLVLAHAFGVLLYEIGYCFHPFCNVRIKKVMRLFACFVIIESQCIKATAFLKSFANVDKGNVFV